MSAELTFGAPAHDVVHQRALTLRIALRPAAPQDAADVAALEQDQVERNFWNRAGGEADHQITSLPAERAQRRLRIVAADRVVDHVNAVGAAEAFESIAQ